MSAVEIAKGRRAVWRSVMGMGRAPVGSNNSSVNMGMVGGRQPRKQNNALHPIGCGPDILCREKEVRLMSSKSQPDVTIRTAKPDDSSVCGQICYDAFLNINTAHGFPCDFPGPEAPTRVLSMMFSSPGFYCVVAEIGGRIVGSNCLYERSTAGGVGPITVDPSTQHVGIGRKLMQAVMDRAKGRNAGLRLVEAAFHNRSLALYTSLGFDVREPLSCLQGRTH